MGEILSQDEIDSLLASLQSGEVTKETIKEESSKSVKKYDFKHPDRFSKDQIRTLNAMHEHFARLFSTSLSAFMRTVVEVKLVSVDQLSYDEFIRSIPNPTCINLINMPPLEGNALLEFSPALSFTIIDRLMGGTGHMQSDKNRELTEIEQTIIEKIIYRAFDNLREAWSNVTDLNPSIEATETNPQLFIQLNLPTEMVVLMTLEIRLGESTGTMSICIPYVVLEPVSQQLSSKSWFSASQRRMDNASVEALRTRVRKVGLNVTAVLGETKLSLSELLNLKEGDVIELNQYVTEPLLVKVGNTFRFRGFPGRVKKHNAAKITQIISEEEGADIE